MPGVPADIGMAKECWRKAAKFGFEMIPSEVSLGINPQAKSSSLLKQTIVFQKNNFTFRMLSLLRDSIR
jgi:hypothetical protein